MGVLPATGRPRLNAPLWTITFEIGCYAVFALLASTLRRWWPHVVFAVGVPAFLWWGFDMAAFNATDASDLTIAIFFGAFFGAGSFLAVRPALGSPLVVAALLVAGAVAYGAGSQVIGLALSIPAATVFVGTRAWPVVRRVGRFGDLSYGIYLWGWPVQQVVATHLGMKAGYWARSLTSLAIVMPLAALSWHMVEKRALRAKPSARTRWPHALTLERA